MKALKVYFERRHPSWAIYRVLNALRSYPHPKIQVAGNVESADVVVFHVTGRLNHLQRYIDATLQRGQQYVLIQYALRSTRNPNTTDWLDVWEKAKLVWSYYDLPRKIFNDGQSLDFDFYHSPLGADPRVFYPQVVNKRYLVTTTGATYVAECIDEVFKAADKVGGKVAHIGRGWDYQPHVDYYTRVYDGDICSLYNKSQYVSGLRRKEGFELPAVEALMCGTRPILFDQPDYRRWFDQLAFFVPEDEPELLIRHLTHVFSIDTSVTADEIDEARRRFDWQSIIHGFWERLL